MVFARVGDVDHWPFVERPEWGGSNLYSNELAMEIVDLAGLGGAAGMHHEIALPRRLEQSLRGAYRAYAKASAAGDRDARIGTGQRLAAIARAGRDAHWRWTVLAAPCGITPERLRQIANTYAAPGVSVADVPAFPDFERKLRRARAATEPQPLPPRGRLTDQERGELRELAAVAKTNTGSVPLNDPRRKASERFSELIIGLRERRVTWRELAEASGHTQIGLRMRAARYGLGSLPPSVAPYRRINIHESAPEASPPPKRRRRRAD